ncbi:hypothetical protein ACQEU8_24495 [Streptomyces sp. CA-250714]|uniref:hypothetical protein n=1 Tax=Streptomyces sp. CA-250714 TaxID=3240060 RepID=UPI003D90BBB3
MIQRLIRGNVSADGHRTAGRDFKVLKMGTGKYAILFNGDFIEPPTVTVTILGGDWNYVDNTHVAEVTTEQAIIVTGDYYGSPGDRPFGFVAVD